jgi:hypothetical protein
MSDLQHALRRSLGVIAGVLAIGCALVPAASAGVYGEITHFGSKGTAEGQFEGSLEANAIGVDPRDNSVYVVDLPGEKAVEKDEFRLQKFKAKEGKYEQVASVRFKPANDEKEETDVVEGIAVNPAENRVYLLSVEERNPEKVGEVDPNVGAATQIYAFSTVESGKALVPATGTPQEGKELGVLAGTKVLNPLSTTPGQALLEPAGITVDPTNGDVIILGEEDATGNGGDEQIALERVSKTGVLGSRWVDNTEYFEDSASSPAVTSTGKVLVGGAIEGFEEIAEIPANFSSTAAPTTFGQTQFAPGLEKLTRIPGAPEPASGGVLSIGEEGTIYAKATIANQYKEGGFLYPGIDEFTSAGVEKGWTGGQSIDSVEEGGPCKIALTPSPQIAAGKGGDVFVYNVNKQLSVPVDQILEFGPGGGGCPVGTATAPAAFIGSTKVSEAETIPIANKVRLTSTLTESNALEVEWDFGDGTKETVKTREYQTTEVTHQFKATGTLTVKEKIHTDSLEKPVIEVESKVKVESNGPAVVAGAPKAVSPTSETLAGTVNPKGSEVTECKLEYGTASVSEKSVPCSPAPGSGTTPVAVSATVTGLTAHTSYKFVIFAKNANGETTSNPPVAFTTGPPPVAVTGAPSAVGQTTATFNGTVNPEGGTVESCFFEYGIFEAGEHEVSCTALPGFGTSPVAVTAVAAGLNAGASYRVRLVAKEAGGLSGAGSEAEFKTEAAPVVKTTEPPPAETKTTPPPSSPPPVKDALPAVKIALSSAAASSSGAFTLKVSCPAGAGTCAGTLTLKTAKAVLASVGTSAKSKASILTLGSTSFSVSSGQSKTVTVHLSAKARKLLAKLKKILAKVTVVARNSEGVSSTTTATVRLKAAKAKAHH